MAALAPLVLTEAPKHFLARLPTDAGERAHRIPGRQWDGIRKMWIFPKTVEVFKALQAEFKSDADVFAIKEPERGVGAQVDPFESEEGGEPDALEDELTNIAQEAPIGVTGSDPISRALQGIHDGVTEQQKILQDLLTKQEDIAERLTELEAAPNAASKEIRVVKELPGLLDLSKTADVALFEKAQISVAFVTSGRDQNLMNWLVKQKPMRMPMDFVSSTHELIKTQLETIAGIGGPETNFWDLVKHIREERLIYCQPFEPVQVFYVLGAMNSIRRQFAHPRNLVGEGEKMARSILYLMNLAMIWSRIMVDEESTEETEINPVPC